jgi:hypothetical protein
MRRHHDLLPRSEGYSTVDTGVPEISVFLIQIFLELGKQTFKMFKLAIRDQTMRRKVLSIFKFQNQMLLSTHTNTQNR